MSLGSWFIEWEVRRHMVNIVQAIINWLSLGPLKGYRTYVLSTIQFVLAGTYSLNLWNIKSHITPDQMIQIQLALSGASSIAAANHQTPVVKPPSA